VIERVRAILITPAGRMLAIKRARPGQKPYWVLPGGHVDAEDAGLEEALCRELAEELAGQPSVASLLHVLERAEERQYFYLGRISHWSFSDKTGPEFTEPGRGEYLLEEIPLTSDVIDDLDLKPAEIAGLLRQHIHAGRDLFTLPDLRQQDRRGTEADLHTIALAAARAGAEAIRNVLASGDLTIRRKTTASDLVSSADFASEQAIVDVIRSHRPDDAILAEESGEHPGSSGVQWLIDPLDGTANFVHGRPDHAISIAAADPSGRPAAVVYRPADDMFLATSTDGLAGSRRHENSMLSVAGEELVAIGLPHDPAQRAATCQILKSVLDQVGDFRRTGSAACELLAAATGTIDAYLGFGLELWDYAAGHILVQATGGATSEIQMPGVRVTVAGAPSLVNRLTQRISSLNTDSPGAVPRNKRRTSAN
jgi:myo-inositol-1(or 4)-monophosphatase